jgi:hypothetical protein
MLQGSIATGANRKRLDDSCQAIRVCKRLPLCRTCTFDSANLHVVLVVVQHLSTFDLSSRP